MSQRPIIQVAELVGVGMQTGAYERPYFLIETMLTSDGPRSRVCDGRWETYLGADAERKRRIEAMK